MTKHQKREKVAAEVAKLIADKMPKEFLHEAIEDAIREYFTEFRINAWEIQKVFEEAVKERTRELLRTTYADKIDALANQAASKVVGERPRPT